VAGGVQPPIMSTTSNNSSSGTASGFSAMVGASSSRGVSRPVFGGTLTSKALGGAATISSRSAAYGPVTCSRPQTALGQASCYSGDSGSSVSGFGRWTGATSTSSAAVVGASAPTPAAAAKHRSRQQQQLPLCVSRLEISSHYVRQPRSCFEPESPKPPWWTVCRRQARAH
jgi:hypothetical protein